MMEKVLNFLVICCFCSAILSSVGATETATENAERMDGDVVGHEEGMDEGTFSRYSNVATTPKIQTTELNGRLSRYEQGLEDYDEAAARLDNEEKAEKRRDAGGGNSPYTWRGGNNSWERTVNFIGDVVSLVRSLKSYQDTSTEATAQASLELARNSSTNSTESLIGSQLDDIDETASTTEVAEGRYIHGDPLKGYYDFVITEGSYKFWAAFQLATAALIIYSTFAAIYYSKVNPIVSDYDYVDYLGGRSLAGGRSFDGDNVSEESESPSSWLPSLNSSWVSTAVHGFQFVMDAIEKIPQ